MTLQSVLPFTAQLIGDMAAEAALVEQSAMLRSAQALSREIAEASNLEAEEVFDALTLVPDNMLALLSSPEGWAALAQYVAADLGVQGLNYRPRVH